MFGYRCSLRWSDLDAQGHVNNAVIVDYLQEARVAFLRSGPASPLLDSGIVVVSHELEYHRPVEYRDDPVTVELGISQLGASRLEVAYELRQSDRVAVVARTVLCAFDFDLQSPVRLQPDHRGFFAGHRIDAGSLRTVEAPSLNGRGTPVSIKVRWSDLDSYGHVNNAMVFDYVQQARITATTGWDPAMARVGTQGSDRMWLVVRQDVDYVAQIGHRIEPYVARVAPVKLGGTSITLATELIDPDSDEVLVRARTVLVSSDMSGRPVDLGAETRSRLAAHLVAG